MIAAQQHAVVRQVDGTREFKDPLAKRGGPHAGVAAVLIHLVRRGLDQRQAPRAVRKAQRSLQHQWVRGAHGVYPHWSAGLVTADQIQHRVHTGCSMNFSSGSIASSAAARDASMMATTVMAFGVAPSTIIETMAVIIGAPALASGATTSALP